MFVLDYISEYGAEGRTVVRHCHVEGEPSQLHEPRTSQRTAFLRTTYQDLSYTFLLVT